MIHDLYNAAITADKEWSRQLQAKYGKRAGDMRYIRGEGDALPGYAAFKATGDAWRAAIDAQRHLSQ